MRYTLHLPRPTTTTAAGLRAYIRRAASRRCLRHRCLWDFALHRDELLFTRQLLAAHPRFWVFRSNQRAACGDFLVVDMSAPCPERRGCWLVELKMGERLREVGTPESHLLSDEIAKTVQRALDELPDDLRTAIVLREFDGLSYEEIANTMECPIGTVRSRIFRAREAIDKRLRPLLNP